jgi:hypothetical protein
MTVVSARHSSMYALSRLIRIRVKDFRHSVCSITFDPNCIRSHDIVLLAPEKTLSTSADIEGIDEISTAMRGRFGNVFACSGCNHHLKAGPVIALLSDFIKESNSSFI